MVRPVLTIPPWVVAWLGLLVAIPAAAGDSWPANPEVRTAILAEEWGRILAHVSGPERPPALRAITGHALLALNRNNESVCLFRRLAAGEDLQEWLAWAEDFARRHPDKPVAHYFHGDALARLGRWDAALEAFTRALALRPNHPLVLNARGVVYAAEKAWDKAVTDFSRAASVHPPLADAYASRGAMWIQKKDGAEGAVRWFSRALHLSPEFGLALNGLASAEFARGHWKEAEAAFQAAAEKGGCLGDLIRENVLQAMEYMSGREDRPLVADGSDEETGTTLDRVFHNLQRDPSQWNANRFVSYLRESPHDVGRGMSMVQQYAVQNPAWGQKVLGLAHSGVRWNTEAAQGWTNLVGSLHVTAGVQGRGFTGQVGYNPGNWATQQTRITQGNLAIWNTMEHRLSPVVPIPGGVTADLTRAHVDSGAWPVRTDYGLFYPAMAK